MTAILVSYVNHFDGHHEVYPIHVTIESGKFTGVLMQAFNRQMEYFQSLNEYMVDMGILSDIDKGFTLQNVASFFTDRGSVVGKLRKLIEGETHRSILHFYELLHAYVGLRRVTSFQRAQRRALNEAASVSNSDSNLQVPQQQRPLRGVVRGALPPWSCTVG